MGKKIFDPGALTIQEVQQVFRYLGVETEFVIVPNSDHELWVETKEMLDERSALLFEARDLLHHARDLLHHVAHNGQSCPGCDLERCIDALDDREASNE